MPEGLLEQKTLLEKYGSPEVLIKITLHSSSYRARKPSTVLHSRSQAGSRLKYKKFIVSLIIEKGWAETDGQEKMFRAGIANL